TLATPPVGGTLSDTLLSLFMVSWIGYALLCFFFPAKSQQDILLRLLAHHLFTGAFIVLVIGSIPPFITAGWVVMALASYVYLQRAGLLMSLLLLAATAIVDSVTHGLEPETVGTNTLTVAGVAAASTFASLLYR